MPRLRFPVLPLLLFFVETLAQVVEHPPGPLIQFFIPGELGPVLRSPATPEDISPVTLASTVDRACLILAIRGRRGSQGVPEWARDLCRHRYIFVGGFMHTGTGLIRYLMSTHPLVRAHENTGHTEDEGQYLQSVFPVRRDREASSTTLCGCRVCGYYCPRLQDSIVNVSNREKLFEEWFGHRRRMESVVYNLEKTPDFMALMRSRFFPNVSNHAFPIRHPLCNREIKTLSSDGMKTALQPVRQLRYWLRAWHDLIVRQMPLLTGELAVVRFESAVGDLDGVSQELWRMMGLPMVNDTASNGTTSREVDSAVDGIRGTTKLVAVAPSTQQRGNSTVTSSAPPLPLYDQLHRRLPFHEAQLNVDESAAKMDALIWGGHDCRNFDACAESPECRQLWEASKAVTRFFGYSLRKRRIRAARDGETKPPQFAIWGKEQLAALAHVRWGLD